MTYTSVRLSADDFQRYNITGLGNERSMYHGPRETKRDLRTVSIKADANYGDDTEDSTVLYVNKEGLKLLKEENIPHVVINENSDLPKHQINIVNSSIWR